MNRKNKLKWGLTMLACLLFWAVSIGVAVLENTWKAWAWFAFVTLILLAAFMNFARVVIGWQSVVFTDENLVIVGVFGKKTPIPWNRIKGFALGKPNIKIKSRFIPATLRRRLRRCPQHSDASWHE